MSEINRTADLPRWLPPPRGALIGYGRGRCSPGLGLTAVWTCLLAYGFARLIGIEF